MGKEQRSREEKTELGNYAGQPPRYEGVTVQSLYIPMRDGVGLATEVVLPENLPSNARIPALLTQTRYWRASELRAPFEWFLDPAGLDLHFRDFRPFFVSRSYALIVVDVRGTGESGRMARIVLKGVKPVDADKVWPAANLCTREKRPPHTRCHCRSRQGYLRPHSRGKHAHHHPRHKPGARILYRSADCSKDLRR